MKTIIENQEYDLDELQINGVELEEQEVSILITPYEPNMKIYTSNNDKFQELKQNVIINPAEWKITHLDKRNGQIISATFSAPKEYFSIRGVEEDEN